MTVTGNEGVPQYTVTTGTTGAQNYPQPIVITPTQQQTDSGAKTMSLDDALELVEKARKEEKDKLYPQMEERDQKIEALMQDLQARQEAEEAARLKAEEAEQARLAAEQSDAQRLEQTQLDFEQKLNEIRGEMDRERALRAKESEFAELSRYRYDRLQEESDFIAPQFVDFVSGNSKEQIDAAIEQVKAKTAEIMQQVQEAGRQTLRTTAPPVTGQPSSEGPTGIGNQQVTLTPDDIANMDMGDYAAVRNQLLGAASQRVREQGSPYGF